MSAKPAPVENSLDDFAKRLEDMCDEAKRYGINSVVLLHEVNPIGEMDSIVFMHTPGPTLALGMLEDAKFRLTARHFDGWKNL